MQSSRQQHSLAPPVPGHLCALVQYGNDVTCTRFWQLSIVSKQDMHSSVSGDADKKREKKKEIEACSNHAKSLRRWQPRVSGGASVQASSLHAMRAY